jgi:micrococcal nuclease
MDLFKKWIVIMVISVFFLSGCSLAELLSDLGNQPNLSESSSKTYTVKTIVDGDTIILSDGRKVRYIGINTPERDQFFYAEATDFNRRLVDGEEIRLEFDSVQEDEFGRTLAYVFVGDIFVNLEMIRAGWALFYDDPDNNRFDELLSKTLSAAKKNHVGMWQESLYKIAISEVMADPPGEDEKNLNKEWVLLQNTGKEPIPMKGFILKDQSNHRYVFPEFTLKINGEVKIHTGTGKNTSETLYWGSDEPIWNNSGDTAFLYDQAIQLISSKSW